MTGRGKPTPVPPCPQRDHRGSAVSKWGKRTARGLTYARYRCVPTDADPHLFQLPLDGAGAPQLVPYLPPEPCLAHPGSRITRAGSYVRSGASRQRYRCYPVDGSPPHRFTPLLPRELVHDGARCELCTEHTGVHRGETTSGRGHRTSTPLVARALLRLSRGNSYGAVSVWARQELGEDPTAKKTLTPQNAWRLAADWVEVFSPVLWQPFDEQRRAQALERRANGEPLVVVIDDKPIFSKATAIGGSRQRFAVLTVAEVRLDGAKVRDTSIRLVRAFPAHNKEAYLLLLDELGYLPDFIVSDAGAGILAAVRHLRSRRPGEPFGWGISAHHIRDMLQDNIGRSTKAYPTFQPGELLDEATSLRCVRSRGAFDDWWQRMLRRMDAQGLPANLRWVQWQKTYQPHIEQGLTELDNWPGLPRSTGALEAIVKREIEPVLTSRAQGFGNLLRTNALMDLVVLRLAGEIDRHGVVAERLRRDVRGNGGYAARVRSITDQGTYRSLLDSTVLERLATQYGLS